MVKLKSRMGYVSKAIVSGVVTALGSLVVIMSGGGSFQDVTPVEWVTVALAVASSYGFTYAVPNKVGMAYEPPRPSGNDLPD